MTARTTPQAPGTPTWLDFWCSDIDEAGAFWRDLLGHEVPPGSPEFGGYTIALQDGRYVFGLGPAMPDQRHDVAALYLATDDLDATLARAQELGATVTRPAMDIPDTGRCATIVDPAGVQTDLWQATGVVGYAAVDEIGFPCWQDCITRDVERSAGFLRDLFGYTTEPMGDGVLLAKLGDDGHFTIGGCGEDDEPHWVSYLLVDDLDAMAARAESLGARTTMGPMDIEFGRFVHLTTPGGAPFGLFSGTPTTD
ncbi:VOC family protein [Arsenicicoccus sp. oral taxon 190]|uniref:VOC family protein n=1 Tax=Arsenicicoccus sp. oral taxon 190 TaxID=1658671 RepID=UPI00067A306B|nr:VOC family protein [Arsenicicoccus sp. oral taxon 190]AKT51018.1 hypothetical protein ADJ73_06280 [Arsenicicoccus sp. oral taxon 190]